MEEKNNFVKYKDLLTVNKFDENTNKEKFVFLPTENELVIGRYEDNINMLEFGEKIAVRTTIYEKLQKVAKKLKQYNKNYKLIVVFGFRDMKVQKKYFYEIYDNVKDNFDNEMEMFEYIHEKIAVPEVAGHPTGGAVDVGIYDETKKEIIDFGSKILDWNTKKCYYYNDEIEQKAICNRKLLRNLMLEQEFAPYDGEWWHFSYGDREWAYYYKKEKALYKQVNAEDVFYKEIGRKNVMENQNERIQIEYKKFVPSGNETALVMNNAYTFDEKKIINDKILKFDKTIEQVGFINFSKEYELEMAGGEFCGNATRSAVYYFLDGKPGKLQIKVNKKDIINAGIYENGKVWCEIPLYQGDDVISEKEDGIYQVKMRGITIIVIKEEKSKKYLKDKSKLKENAFKIIEEYKLCENEAVGVMFLEKLNKIKINPIVWVRDINTLYYETACGSGSTAVAMVESFLNNKNQNIEIIQPSGLEITADVVFENKKVINATICGNIKSDNKVVRIFV